MKVGKKASVKIINVCQKYSDKKLGLSTSWEDCFNILSDIHKIEIGLETDKDYEKGETILTVYKGQNQTEKYVMPSSDAFDKKEMDWQWNYIYKYVCELLAKRKIGKIAQKPRKNQSIEFSPLIPLAKQKEIKKLKEKYDYSDIIKEAKVLKKTINTLTKAKEKNKAIKEYNTMLALIEAYKIKNEQIENKNNKK